MIIGRAVRTLSCNNPGQVLCTLVLLSPSSIIWYRCKILHGISWLWKVIGSYAVSITLWHLLLTQDEETDMNATPVCHRAV